MTESYKTIYIDTEFGVRSVTVFADGTIKQYGRILKPADNGAGYLSVLVGYKTSKNNRKVGMRKYVHRLVAEAFIDNPDNLPQVNHKDFDKSNNCVENLEWTSRSDNIQHSHDNGKMRKRYDIGTIAILTKEEVIECYSRVKNGEGVNVVAKSMNKPRTTISSILNKRSRRDITDLLDLQLNKNTTK